VGGWQVLDQQMLNRPGLSRALLAPGGFVEVFSALRAVGRNREVEFTKDQDQGVEQNLC
jgi:hypothetical protein